MKIELIKVNCLKPAYEIWLNVSEIVSIRRGEYGKAFITMSDGNPYLLSITPEELLRELSD